MGAAWKWCKCLSGGALWRFGGEKHCKTNCSNEVKWGWNAVGMSKNEQGMGENEQKCGWNGVLMYRRCSGCCNAYFVWFIAVLWPLMGWCCTSVATPFLLPGKTAVFKCLFSLFFALFGLFLPAENRPKTHKNTFGGTNGETMGGQKPKKNNVIAIYAGLIK